MSDMNRRALKRIPLDKLMDLKVDYAFKQLFGSEKNKDITVVFLNAILARTGRNTIKEVLFVNQEVGGEYQHDKQSRLDIVVRTQENELINIEMQLSNQNDMMKRTLYYWAQLFTDQLSKGESYHTLFPTITINICNFSLFTNTENYHSTYHIYEDSTLQRLNKEDDILEVHFIEMTKFIKAWHADELDPFDDLLVRWLLLLGMVDARKQKVYDDIYLELEALAMKDERLIDAFSVWEELSQTPDSVIAYHSRLKVILDEEAKLKYAQHKGMEAGLAEGIEQGIEQGKKKQALETARVLLAQQIPEVIIQQATGLTLEEIQAIKSKKGES